MTQAEVASAVGLASEVYGRIERGLAMPSVPTLINIANVLRVSPDALLGWTQLQARSHPEAYERILSLLESTDDEGLKRAHAVLQALLSKEPPK
jgi:transcriptional regulator with XRE-family HTH domain